MTVAIVPIALEHAAGIHACIDAVASERRYLAQTFSKPRLEFDNFVRDSVANDLVQFIALDGDRVVAKPCCAAPCAWTASITLHCK